MIPEGSADEQLSSLYSEEWQWRETVLPDSEDSQRPIADFLPEVDEPSQQQRLDQWVASLQALDLIPREQLSDGNQINYDVYRNQLEGLIAAQRQRRFELAVNSDTSFWMDLTYTARRRFRRPDDYRNWVGQLRDIPRFVDQQMELLRSGLARGFTPPRATLEGREASLDSLASGPPERSPLYEPFAAAGELVSSPWLGQLADLARETIRDLVQPAFARLRAFISDEYIPGCRETTAARDLPGGEAFYRQLVRESTTEDHDPKEIHDLGLSEVARLDQEMRELAAREGLGADIPAIRERLRADPANYAASGEALLRQAAWTAKLVDGQLDRFFGRLPRSRFAIKPVPEEIAPFYTAGRGGPGVYLVNTFDLAQRPLHNLAALTVHEAEPGHAFQMALALDDVSVPDFRRQSYHSAYGEGWAIYCEWLGREMGVYQSPLEVLGMLGYQSWRASRLVIDTGIHALGWSRSRSRQYLREHSLLWEREIETEVDRYISWPAQALSYYLGERAILEMRLQAERGLGAGFDLRRFHDAVLALGCVPLPVLRRVMGQFIARGGGAEAGRG